MEWVMQIIDEMRRGNFSFLILVAAVVQIVVMAIANRKTKRRK